MQAEKVRLVNRRYQGEVETHRTETSIEECKIYVLEGPLARPEDEEWVFVSRED